METSISIPRSAVFSQVARRTEWQGTRSPEDRDYERLTLSSSDKALFHSFFDEAAMHAIDLCRPFLQRVANTDEALTLTLRLTEGPDSDSLQKTLENLLTSHVLTLWQEIVSPARAAATLSRRDDYALKLQSILYYHPVPARKSGAPASQYGAPASQPGEYGAPASQPAEYGAPASQPGEYGAPASQPAKTA